MRLHDGRRLKGSRQTLDPLLEVTQAHISRVPESTTSSLVVSVNKRSRPACGLLKPLGLRLGRYG